MGEGTVGKWRKVISWSSHSALWHICELEPVKCLKSEVLRSIDPMGLTLERKVSIHYQTLTFFKDVLIIFFSRYM